MTSTFNITDLSSLDTASVLRNLSTLTQLLHQQLPDADVRRGTMHDIVLFWSAVLDTAFQANVGTIQQSNSLLSLTENPELANTDVVDRLLSNYNLTRLPGAQASGTVQIVLNQAAVVTIPKGMAFAANGLTFVTPAAFTSRVAASSVLSPTDRLVTAAGASYVFTITVQATTIGAGGNLSRGTRLAPAVSPSPYFTQAYALADFAGGADAETNGELLTRLSSGLGAKAWSNRMTADALIRSQAAFQHVLGESIIGYGDPEMLRDQHSVWPGSFGGRVDVYVRTQPLVADTALAKTAMLVGLDSAGRGVWQFSLARNEVPAFFEVAKVTQAGLLNLALTGYSVTSDLRGYDLTGLTGPLPDVANAAEANFTRFSTAAIQFVDTDTATTGLTVGQTTRQYDVSVLSMPLVDQIQDYLRGRGVTAPGGDVLVKAPMPVFVSVSFTVQLRPGMAAPDTAAVQQAVADAVNGLGFGNKLSSVTVSSAVSPLVEVGAVITNLQLAGKLRYADNTVVLLSSGSLLVPPDDATQPMTTQRTLGYFLKPADVHVSVTTVDGPPV